MKHVYRVSYEDDEANPTLTMQSSYPLTVQDMEEAITEQLRSQGIFAGDVKVTKSKEIKNPIAKLFL